MFISIMAKLVEACHHLFLQSVIYLTFGPKISHPVLDPLKIRNSYTSGIGENVRDHKYSFIMQYFIRLGSRWPIRPFSQDLAPNTVGIFGSNLILRRAWSKNVAFDLKQFLIANSVGFRKALKRFVFIEIRQNL